MDKVFEKLKVTFLGKKQLSQITYHVKNGHPQPNLSSKRLQPRRYCQQSDGRETYIAAELARSYTPPWLAGP